MSELSPAETLAALIAEALEYHAKKSGNDEYLVVERNEVFVWVHVLDHEFLVTVEQSNPPPER